MTMIDQDIMVDPVVWQMSRSRFRAMNTDIQFSLLGPDSDGSVRIVAETFRYFEGMLSRFRPDSELSRFNDSDRSTFPASQDFFTAVEAALWAAQQTNGIYDPTILACLEDAGYDSTFDSIANPRPLGQEEIAAETTTVTTAQNKVVSGPDYRHFYLDSFSRSIQRPGGIRLDLGGMGKGWTVDRAVDELCGQGHFLLNAGGDLYAYGMPGNQNGWQIHLAHPLNPELDYASLTLHHQGVATSTLAKRRWVKNNITQHHLIDPRTGQPAVTDAISVSVIAGRVFPAEVYAKAALILGIEKGLSFLESLPDVEGAIFSINNEVHLTSRMDPILDRIEPSGY